MQFFGHVFSEQGITVDPAKVAAIQGRMRPHNAMDVRSSLGLAGFYKRFIKNFSKTGVPLRSLTKKNLTFTWVARCK